MFLAENREYVDVEGIEYVRARTVVNGETRHITLKDELQATKILRSFLPSSHAHKLGYKIVVENDKYSGNGGVLKMVDERSGGIELLRFETSDGLYSSKLQKIDHKRSESMARASVVTWQERLGHVPSERLCESACQVNGLQKDRYSD